MMSKLLGILMIAGVIYGGMKFNEYWKKVKADQDAASGNGAATAAGPPAHELPGLPPGFEASLAAAQKQGPMAMKKWLDAYRKHISDPRLAAIELDYVVLAGMSDRREAKKVFASVQARVKPDSPLYKRVQALEKTYK